VRFGSVSFFLYHKATQTKSNIKDKVHGRKKPVDECGDRYRLTNFADKKTGSPDVKKTIRAVKPENNGTGLLNLKAA